MDTHQPKVEPASKIKHPAAAPEKAAKKHLLPYINFQHCNWLQVQDNAANNYHLTALHAGKSVVDGHYQGTAFDEVGAASMEVAPDMQFIPIHHGRGLACAGAGRVNKDRLFSRGEHRNAFVRNGFEAIEKSAQVDHQDFILSEEERAETLITCVSRAKGPVLVLDL